MKNNLFKTLTLSACISTLATASAGEVEIIHWWTSGGEGAAVNVLKQDVEKKGVLWKDVPIAGGGGDAAKTVLSARLTAGNPPVAAQSLGFDIVDLAKQGALGNLNEVAAAENWDEVIPSALQRFSKYDGNWVAAPVNVHSTNWVWANKKILDDLGIAQPKTWDEFVAALKKVKASGKIALAHGGQAWQDATLFDSAVLSAGGPEFYQKALIDLDEAALTSDTMVEAFNRMKVLRDHVDDNFSGRDWNLASAKVINGEAAFQIMGDWAKGEFLKANKVAGEDFLCFRTPGTDGSVTFNSDQFAMFSIKEDAVEDQHKLASSIMSPTFQSAFNVVKGSVPARTDVPNDAFGYCGKKGMKDLAEASKSGKLLGSMAHGHAAPASIKNAVYDVVTAHFNGEFGSSKEAVEELKEAISIAK